jgi:hypothetical protein
LAGFGSASRRRLSRRSKAKADYLIRYFLTAAVLLQQAAGADQEIGWTNLSRLIRLVSTASGRVFPAKRPGSFDV